MVNLRSMLMLATVHAHSMFAQTSIEASQQTPTFQAGTKLVQVDVGKRG